MKIFSNFDTKKGETLYHELCNSFGEEYVLFICKSRLVWLLTIVLPLLGFVTLVVLGAYFVYMYADAPSVFLQRLFRGIVILWGVILLFKLLPKRIDFSMDFLIITPKEIIRFDQQGFLTRETEKIAADKIKTITTKKEGFLASFFDVGSLIFLAEGDHDSGDIIMEAVDNLEVTEKKIRHILGMDKK